MKTNNSLRFQRERTSVYNETKEQTRYKGLKFVEADNRSKLGLHTGQTPTFQVTVPNYNSRDIHITLPAKLQGSYKIIHYTSGKPKVHDNSSNHEFPRKQAMYITR